MNTFLWVLQGILAAFFIIPGVGKMSGSRASHIADGLIKPGEFGSYSFSRLTGAVGMHRHHCALAEGLRQFLQLPQQLVIP